LDAHLTTERLVGVIVTIDSSDFGEPVEAFGSFLVCGLEVLAVAAPRGIEFEDLYKVSRLVLSSSGRLTEVWFDCAISESYVLALTCSTGEPFEYMPSAWTRVAANARRASMPPLVAMLSVFS
jgi:hypothetical protein